MPGFLFCLSFGAIAVWLDKGFFQGTLVINYVIIAILLGLLINNVIGIPEAFKEGIDFSTKTCLYTGIVLLGAGMNLVRVFSIGFVALIMVAVSISISIVFCGWLAKKMGNAERSGHLVGAGMGICGISAIMALAPAIKAKEREIITAISAVILSDLIVLLTLPSIGHLIGWSDHLAGFFSGIVPANTAQSIAIGHAHSDVAGEAATIIKSARNALLPVVVLTMSYIYTSKGLPVGETVRLGLLWSKFPKFILGFLIAATLSTAGVLPQEGIAAAKTLATWFFVVCFVGLGAGINFKGFSGRDLTVLFTALATIVLLGLYVYGIFYFYDF